MTVRTSHRRNHHRPVRILFVTHYFHPEVGAAPTRILELADELSSRGHAVSVLTGFPNYPDGVIPADYRGRLFQVERLRGLRVVRTAVYPAPNRGVVRRLLNHASFALSSVLACRRAGPADVVIVETPPLFTAVAGVLVAGLKRAPLLLNVADLWPDAAIQFGALRNRAAIAGAGARALRVPPRRSHRGPDARSARVSCASAAVRPSRSSSYRMASIRRASPALPTCGRFPGGLSTAARSAWAMAVGTLIEAARTLDETDDDYELLIVGDGAERAELEALARQWGLRSVTFAGRMPRERLPELLATADVTVATERDRPLLAGALSIKVLEYMAAARPVVAAASGWTAEVIVSAEAGHRLSAGAAGGTRRGDRQSDCGPWPSASLGLNGRRYVEAHLTVGWRSSGSRGR